FIRRECGSHVPQVILFGTIPTSIPVIPVVYAEVPIAPADPLVALDVGIVSVISPIGVLDLVDYSSSSDSDPTKDSLLVAPELPLVSPFLCFDDSEADSESKPAEQRPERHESLTPSSEFPLAPVVAPPGIRRRPAILVRVSEAIPFGRPYLTHPNGSRKLLTARKRVGPFPARRLAWRRVSHHFLDRYSSPDFTSDSYSSSSSSDSSLNISSGSSSDSLSYSSSVHSSGCDAWGQSHSGPSTRVASPRLVDPPPWSTLYPPTTSESSPYSSFDRSLDSSSLFVGPSRKRCRSPTTLVPSSTLVSRSIAPTLADLPPRTRFRDSYSSEGVGAHTEDGIDLGVEVATSDIREDEEEFEAEASTGGLQSLRLLRDSWRLVSWWLVERTGLADRVRSLGRENLRVRALLCTERDHDNSLRRHMALSQEEFCKVHRDRDDTRRRLRRLESLVERTMTNTRFGMTPAAIEEMVNRRVTKALETREANRNIGLGNYNDEGGNENGNGNGNRGGNGNGNHNENDRDARPVV
ncbi:hypothetical protein Tco_0693929, partial [Tanacetum coccineum]